MKYLLLVYIDPERLGALSQAEYDTKMRGCLEHADELQAQGCLLDFQQLQPVQTARTLRVREGRAQTLDGPFAETKELLGGFNLVEAESMEAALELARSFPWAEYGAIEVRPVRDIAAVRVAVGAPG